ncbi:hypothetical protein MPTK1_2g11500 [Marchantia polymorpha subsp. ruderalis]|nr:hypothetical protein MARPO_0023s0116 [Marchantia polymorpha]BBN01947.1 hypothetical protein Mp_2g11500 [Marchantia polymorpha subsp. ruderalis]|eukprot:PTQ43809.1 hypothetical protein MARPO_0023s0116 [Marchantia polymorpha]
MGRYQRDISELGPLSIIRETVIMCYDNAATLVWIQVTMVLPTMIAIMGSQQLLDLATEKLAPAMSPPNPADFSPLKLVQLIGVYIAVLLINLAISIVSIAAIFYTVGCSYTGKSVTFSEILRTMPKVWRRLLITGLWGFLIATTVILINAVTNLLVSTFLSSKPWIVIPVILLITLAVLVFSFYFGAILQVANGVTTLEEYYGIAALSKSEKLLRGKWWTALGLFLIYTVPVGALAYANECAKKYLDLGEHESLKKLLMQALFILINSLMLQWSTLSGGVLYVACKAFHHESIVLYVSLDTSHFERMSQSTSNPNLEREIGGYFEPRPSFGRAAFNGEQLKDELEAVLSRAGPYRKADTSSPRHSFSSVDELEISVEEYPPELSRSRRSRGKGPLHNTLV